MTGTSYNGTMPGGGGGNRRRGARGDHPDRAEHLVLPLLPRRTAWYATRAAGIGEDIDFLYDFVNSGRPEMRAACNENVRDEVLIKLQDRVTGDLNDFWAGRDYLPKMANMKCALFMSHGWNDWNVMPEHSVRIYEEAKRRGLPAWFFAHQRGHGGPPPFDLQNRFFTRYLYESRTGSRTGPGRSSCGSGGSVRRPILTIPTRRPSPSFSGSDPAGDRPGRSVWRSTTGRARNV